MNITHITANTEKSVQKQLLTIFFLSAAVVQAQSWPAKPMRIVVPFPAGGPVDVTVRIISPKVSEALGQNLVIEARPGASSLLGSEFVARAAPDGYTALIGTVSNTITPSVVGKMPYDFARDFESAGQFLITTSIVTAHPSLPVKSIKELIALARARPGQIIYGSAGNGTPSHLAGELMKTLAGIQMLHVPYKGGAPAAVEQVAGQVQIALLSAPAVIPFMQQGRLRGLAVTNARRSLVMPELPTVAESGLPGYESEGWSGVFLPAKTPAAVTQRIHREFAAAVRDAEVRAKLIAVGTEPAVLTPEELAKKVRDELTRWAKVVKASGMKVD
jgi:tripartite-type tricarboxylate transporter receptor subunit TctC